MLATGARLNTCPGCGGSHPNPRAASQPGLKASPGCWSAYRDLVHREEAEWGRPAIGRLTAHAYAAQHPGKPSPESVRALAAHLGALCAVVERGLSLEEASAMAHRMAESDARYEWLSPPRRLGSLTLADVVAARDLDQHERRVRRWARSVWEAWSPHHVMVREWLDRYGRA